MHPFEQAGLGKAPFRCVGVQENVYTTAGGAHQQAGGTCNYCGTGIRWEYVIKSSDNHQFVVGCDCVEKTGANEITDGYKQIRAAWLKERRAVTNAKAKAKRDAERAVRQVEWERNKEKQRIVNRGIWNEKNPELNDQLVNYAGTNEFIKHIISNLEMWGSLTERQIEVVTKALETEKLNATKISAHIGQVGDKIEKKCKVTFCKLTGYTNYYPAQPIYLVKLITEAGESLVWFTNKQHEVGKEFNKFTVKDHSEYMGEKETVVKLVK